MARTRNPALLLATIIGTGIVTGIGAGGGLVGAVSDADAAPRRKAAGKPGQACGAKVLPLAVGNSWTYNPIAAPAALPEAMARLVPPQPRQIVVTVTAIDTDGADTVVSLEEKHGFDVGQSSATPKIVEQVVKATITCNAKGKFDISPESFFFAGEPGGFYGLTFESFDRKKETSLKLLKGTIGENEWIEEISAKFKREPAKGSEAKLGGGTLELERKFTPQQPEHVTTKMGSYKAEKLGVTTTGRVTLEDALAPEGKPCTTKKFDAVKKAEVNVPTAICELPANWISQLWLVEGVGLVQSLNSYAHMYQLVDMQLK